MISRTAIRNSKMKEEEEENGGVEKGKGKRRETKDCKLYNPVPKVFP